jgi:hypothetical protein
MKRWVLEIKKPLSKDKGFFEPTPEWDDWRI